MFSFLHTSGLSALVLTGLLLAFPLAGQSQSDEGERRVMDPDEVVALSEWAMSYLEMLGSDTVSTTDDFREDLRTNLERLRATYFLSVEKKEWVERAEAVLRSLKFWVTPGQEEYVSWRAYQGALEVVKAKHARWPPSKLNHLKTGVGILDELVESYPDDLEVRYLRLVSCYYLPFFLKREESVAADFQVLAAHLPDHPDAFSPTVYRGVVQFVLEKGTLTPRDRARLEEALG